MGRIRHRRAGFVVTRLGFPLAHSPTTAARRILIGATLAAIIWSVSAGKAGLWPFAIFALALVSAGRFDRMVWRHTTLDLPLLLFLGTALIGVWAAYDRDLALHKLWMLLGAYLLFYAIAAQPRHNLWTIVTIFAGLGCVLAIVFLLTTDWQAYPPKFAFIRHLVQSWTSVRPSLSLRGMHPNVAGGLMALLLPFQLAWTWRLLQEQGQRQALTGALALALTALALLLTSSRGAMLSLAASLTFWTLWRQMTRWQSALQLTLRWRYLRLLVSLLIISLTATLFIIFTLWHSQLERMLQRLPGSASLMDRAALAGQTLDLIADFPVMGGGLASFPGLYSRYILGTPFFYLPNGHNILLDVALEQGFLGAVALFMIVITTFWLLLRHTTSKKTLADSGARLLAGATFSSLVILLLHGMVEDTVYGSFGLPLLLAMPAMAVALNRATRDAHVDWQLQWRKANIVVWTVCGLLLVASLLFPRTRATWLANLASIQMAQVELAHFPSGQWDDGSEIARLAAAERMFESSVRLNARQITAYYRLGLIAMLRRDYEEAVNQLQLAYEQNTRHIGIRKALGYSYAWSGNVEQGIKLLSQAPFVNQELNAYGSWWPSHGRSDLGLIAVQMQERIQTTGQDSPME